MDTFFVALIVMIVVAGSAHTIVGIYREKEKQQRWREAVKRLNLRDSNSPG
jgi:hypothetical protein